MYLKLKPNENLENAVVQAMQEELGLEIRQYDFHAKDRQEVEENESFSYPGLLSRYVRFFAHARLRAEAVKPEYVEIQADKETVSVWKAI